MPDDSTIFALPAVMRTEDSISLHTFLSAHHDEPVTLDGSQVQKFTGLAAQVIAAHLKWRVGTDNRITLSNESVAVKEAMTQLDLDAAFGGCA